MVREEHIDFPDLERYSDTPLFNTKAVVQQTGVPAPTLRAWERRYTILSPHRTNHVLSWHLVDRYLRNTRISFQTFLVSTWMEICPP